MPKKKKLPVRFVEELIAEIIGPEAVPLIRLMVDKDYISEFKLAEKLKISVNKVRNILYRLQGHNLVDFIRKKDKKKGWYIYYWLFDLNLARKLIKEMKGDKLAYLNRRLEHEKEESYYICPNGCIRLNARSAIEHNFRCEECGEILNVEDTKESFMLIKKEIEQLKEDLKELEKEFVIKAREEKLKKAKEKIKKRKPKKSVRKKRIKKKARKKVKIKRKKETKKPKKKARKKIKKKIKRKPKKELKKKTVSKLRRSKKYRKFLKKLKKIKKSRR